jgi:glutamyl-tRNA synthetase
MLRFAPSPTGDMQIDDLRLALFNYIVSLQKNEDFIIRIEDLDKKNNIEGSDKEILDILDLFGIKYTQTIHQSQNVKFHAAMALQLLHEKKAFSCFCSDEWIDSKKDEAKKQNKPYLYDDACRNLPAELVIDNTNPFRIRITRPDKDAQSPTEIDSFVIMNQDKTPTHDFASAVDDMISDISTVVRYDKYIHNTPKQEHIRSSLGYEKKIQYIHIPTMKNSDISVKSLLQQGFLPEAIINYLVSTFCKTPEELFSLEEAVKFFKIENISHSPAEFNLDALKKINQKHLKQLDPKELSRYVGFADKEIGELAGVYLDKVYTTKELKTKIEPIFASKKIPSEFKDEAKSLTEAINAAPFFEKYEDFKGHMLRESKMDENRFEDILHYMLTGTNDGTDIKEIYRYLKNFIGEIVK